MKYFLLILPFWGLALLLNGQSNFEYNNLTSLLRIYFDAGEYEKAIPIAEKIIQVTKKIGETSPEHGTSLNNLAVLYDELGNFEKAEPLYKEALEIKKKAFGENHIECAAILNNLALLYENIAKFDDAVKTYNQSLSITKKNVGENHPDFANTLGNLGLLYERMGQNEKAEMLLVKSSEIYKITVGESHSDYAWSMNNLAGLYVAMGQYQKAEVLYTKTLTLRKKLLGDTHNDYATTLNDLALLYEKLGRYEKSEQFYLQALGIYKTVMGPLSTQYAGSLNNLAVLYSSMGQYKKAELLQLEALDICKKTFGESHPNYAVNLNNLSLLYVNMWQFDTAERLQLQALSIYSKHWGVNNVNYATSLSNLALLYERAGLYDKIIPLGEQVLSIYKSLFGEDHPGYAMSLNNLAVSYTHVGEYEKARILCEKALTTRKKLLGDKSLEYAESLDNLTAVYINMGLHKLAEPLILEECEIVTSNFFNTFPILSEKEKQAYLENKVFILSTSNSFLYNYKMALPASIQRIGNTQLLYKGMILESTRGLLASMQDINNGFVKEKFDQWSTYRAMLAKQYSLALGDRRSDLKQIEAKTESLEKELNKMSPEFRNQQAHLKINFRDVQKNLLQDEMAIEFVKFQLCNKTWTDTTIYAAYFINRKDSVPVFIPLFDERQLENLLDSAGKTTESMVRNFYRGIIVESNNTAAPLGQKLYNLIWAPLEPYLKGIKKISYSPAGKLYSIAFHALPVDSATILMDKYELQQYTSTRQVALRESENQFLKPTDIYLFGNANFSMDSLQLVRQRNEDSKKENATSNIYTPQNRGNRSGAWDNLPGTAEEVNRIKLLFDQNKIITNAFTQTAASEENLKALNGNSPQILHIATHGFFLPEPEKKKKERNFDEDNAYTMANDPLLRSGLILAGGNYAWSGKTPIEGMEDGIATAYEISQLDLSNTELVVLSACETALGDIKGSEGVFGLQRAFKMAGVKKMIVSLWQVPDKETAELMEAFYTYWMKGKSISEAFTQAQADMRKKYPPFYWAAFVLIE